MGFKCIHIADVHFRGLTRHEEYRDAFEDFFRQARDLEPDVIYVGGDIVHSKTQGISPELIDILNWWFTSLANIAPTHVILGNHDGLIANKQRQDAISPILDALSNPNIFLYKKSGVYPTGVSGFNWCVFSCFDEEGWKDIRPVANEINIALFHGGVQGSATDIDWQIEGEVEVGFFEEFEFAFLGDIHKLQYLDKEKRVAYPGSTIQQNYGEDSGKGFLFWDIKDRDNFISQFYPVAHRHPYVTLDWDGDLECILQKAKGYPDESRFRIRASDLISQAEIKQLHVLLKEEKNPYEIVFKYEQSDSIGLTWQSDHGDISLDDFRDAKTHIKLMQQYYSDLSITNSAWERLEKLINKYVNELVANNKSIKNTRWSLKRLEFENIFSYGKENVVDFDKLSGITGIFGRNRSGKSSIPGALMYALYNTTDRGAIKNLHIINSRKGHCRAKVDFLVDGNRYRAERQSVKHQTRAGKVHAVTHLNLSRLNSDGEEIQDLNGEQRRETEKILRELIGTSEDFLMTSLASQGEMNSFVKNRTTQRKTILNKFLALDIFENMHSLAKEESSSIKTLLKNVPDKDWDKVIENKEDNLVDKRFQKEELEKQFLKAQASLEELNITLATHGNKDAVTQQDIDDQIENIENFENKNLLFQEKIKDHKIQKDDLARKLLRILKLKEQFPIDELKEQFEIQHDLEKNLLALEHSYEKEKNLLKVQKKSVKILNEVPCGDQFPACKFIKNSHINKRLQEGQEQITNNALSNVRASKRVLRRMKEQQYEIKIKRYDEILVQESSLVLENSRMEISLNSLTTQENRLSQLIAECCNELSGMKLRVSSNSNAKAVSNLRRKIANARQDVANLDVKRISVSESIALLQKEIENLKLEKKKYSHLLDEWKCYELFIGAVSKKGIPLQIISSQLPLINAEISKILQGVVGFTVELKVEHGNNDMDIVINYGDSQRIIECASGMEKMMASLAIRVALINISCLPKTDLLIIDEGFGALDEMNVEACNRLLDSLKKWFKNILVISHVDAVKDAVDNVLDIISVGKDAKINYE
ncbi:MAG: hypothetical protein CMB80_05230 [Flammeovirgaceae bacterium]|nr:hypothetical protein [Flammeovirgaceae bacterium]